jgi:hypothetical protein
LAIADFHPFGWLKQRLSGRTLDNEENLPETITEILSELPKHEVKMRWRTGKKDTTGLQTTLESSIRISLTPNCFDIVSLDPRPCYIRLLEHPVQVVIGNDKIDKPVRSVDPQCLE